MSAFLDQYDPATAGAGGNAAPARSAFLDRYDPGLRPAPKKPPGLLDRLGGAVRDFFSRDVYVETPEGTRVKLQTPAGEQIRSGMRREDDAAALAADPMAGVDASAAYAAAGQPDPARTALETGASLATGALSYPGQVTLGLTGIASGMSREQVDRLTEDFGRATTYTPGTAAGQTVAGGAGQGFDALLWPAHKLDALVTELGHPRAAYVARVAAELAIFKGLHAVGRKSRGFIKRKFGLDDAEARMAAELADDARVDTLRTLFAEKLGLDPTAADNLIPALTEEQVAIAAGRAEPYSSRLAQGVKDLSEQARTALPPGQGFVLVGKARSDARLAEGIRQIKARLKQKRASTPAAVSTVTRQPRTLGLGKPKAPATRLRGRIEELGKISWAGERGEMVDMPLSVSFVSNNKTGMPWRDMEAKLKDEGWLEPGESLVELLRTDPQGTLGRRHPADFDSIFTDPANRLTDREKEIRRQIEEEPDTEPDAAFWAEQEQLRRADELGNFFDEMAQKSGLQEQKTPYADERDIVNPVDPTLSQADKALALRKLGEEVKPVIERVLQKIDAERGTTSKTSFKKIDRIIAKANRPGIKRKKPWHDVEHIRDSFRFKTVANTFGDIEAALKAIQEAGGEIVKLDTGKMLEPKEWGWRFAAVDIRMPNGLLVEFYSPLKELEAAKKAGNHALFEKWRNVPLEEVELNPRKRLEYLKDLETSNQRYVDAWDRALKRMGLSRKAAEASWKRVSASLSEALTKKSLSSSAEKMPRSQLPPTRIMVTGSRRDSTITRSPSRSIDTTIEAPPKQKLTQPGGDVNSSAGLRQSKAGLRRLDEPRPGGYDKGQDEPYFVTEPRRIEHVPPPEQIQLVFDPPGDRSLHPADQAGTGMGRADSGRHPGRVSLRFAQPGRDSAIRMQTTGNIRGQGHFVRSAQEVASLLAPLRKKAQEEAFLVITDRDGRLLEVERHTKGTKRASMVDPGQLAGRVFNTPGAKKVYYVHNHPSGTVTPSPQDHASARHLAGLLDLQGVELDSVIIGRGKYARFGTYRDIASHETADIPPIVRKVPVPVRERVLKAPRFDTRINNHRAAREFLKDQGLLDTEGAIFLDTQLRPTGIWKYEKGRPAREFAHSLIAAAERYNAGGVIPFFRQDIMNRGPVREALWNVRDASGLSMPDIILSDSAIDPARASVSQLLLPPKSKPVGEALAALKSGPTLYGGLPVHELSQGLKFWEKYIGGPLWDKLITQKIPDALEKIPVAGRGVSAVRRALDYDYRGDLKNAKGYVSLLDETRQRRQLGAEYGIDLGNRLSRLPEESQLRVGQAITGHDVKLTPAEARLASEASWALLELGKQAVDHGLLSEETFFKNAGKYMPRLYTRHEYQGLLKTYGEKAPSRLDLDRFRRRKDIPKEVRQQMGEILTPGYPVAKAVVQLTHSIETAKWLKTIADNPDWAVRRTPKPEVLAEVKGAIAAARQASPEAPLRDILEGVSRDFPDLAIYPRRVKKGGKFRTETVIENAVEPPEGWVKLKDDPRLGELSGAYVHPEVARDIEWTVRAPSAMEKVMRKWLSRWKYGKVVLSGKTHIRNMYSNALLAHLGGMPLYEQPLYLARAAREMRSGGKYWRMAKREGLLSGTYIQGELRGLFDQVESQMRGVRAGSLEDTMTGLGRAVQKIRAAGKKLGDVYQAEEQWFKLAKFMHDIRRRGMSPKAAAADASKWLFDYGRVTRFQERYRNSLFGAPFATFTFKAIPRVLEAAVKTPHRYVLPAAIIWALEEAARDLFGDTPEQARAKRDLRPEWMQGSFLGIPNFARVPVADAFGREYWLNLSYILPWGELGESGGLFGIPGGLMPFSHPLTKEIAQQLGGEGGYDWFWDDRIVKPEDTAGLSGAESAMAAAKKRGMHALQTFAPTPVMDAMKLWAAARGEPDYRGRERAMAPVLADVALGLKAYPVDYDEQIVRRLARLDPKKADVAARIRARIRTAQVRRAAVAKRGASTELYDRQIAQYRRQLQGLAREAAGAAEIYRRLKTHSAR